MHTAYLALGSNVGDRAENLARAACALAEGITIDRRAPTYESHPVGLTEQPDFYNTVIAVRTDMSPREILSFVKKIENDLGRTPSQRFGPREIDIDIIFYDDLAIHEPDLDIPHPRMAERDFVLMPLAEIAPEAVHPELKKTVAELLADLSPNNVSVMAKVSV